MTGSDWKQKHVELQAATAATVLDPWKGRGGLVFYPHATVDYYVNINDETAATGSQAVDFRVRAGDNLPVQFLDADCPIGTVSAYAASGITIYLSERGGVRE